MPGAGERVPEGAEERFRRSRWLGEDALGIGVRGGHGRLMMVPPAKRGSRTAGRHAAELPALRRVLATGRPESEGLRWRVAVETSLPSYFVLLARSSRGGGHFSIRGGKESLLSAPVSPSHPTLSRFLPWPGRQRGRFPVTRGSLLVCGRAPLAHAAGRPARGLRARGFPTRQCLQVALLAVSPEPPFLFEGKLISKERLKGVVSLAT